ncbi:hypothetical protein L1887_23938 [Cichorium endivia]|nr:hypothetical protein L1887_23938 [Cichorium endivia]
MSPEYSPQQQQHQLVNLRVIDLSVFWCLNGLRSLDLSDNLLEGEIPKEIEDVHNNLFTSEVTEWIGELGNLQTVDLSNNMFSGAVPNAIGFLPTWVFQLGLQSVVFSENKLSGSNYYALTSAIDISYQNLQVLDISHNALSGEIPSEIGSFTNLRLLNISTNSLTGEIPETIGKLKALIFSI